MATKEACVLQSSVHSSVLLVSFQARTRCNWEVCQPSLHLLSSLLLLSCCPHHPSSRILARCAVMLEGSSFLWTCCQTGHPWSESGGGPCRHVAGCDPVRLVTPHCSSWEHLWTGWVRGNACPLLLARHDGQSRCGCSRWSSGGESWVREVGFYPAL